MGVPADADTVAGLGSADEIAGDADDTRRRFLCQSARKLAYAAPVVMLFKPRSALAASGGTQITQA
jgi:hypothetical protein